MVEGARQQFIYTFDPVRPEMARDLTIWTDAEMQIARDHSAYLAQAAEDGIVILAGRAQDGIGPAIVIIEVESETAARAFMAADPFVAHGLMRPSLHPYRVAFMRRNAPV